MLVSLGGLLALYQHEVSRHVPGNRGFDHDKDVFLSVDRVAVAYPI